MNKTQKSIAKKLLLNITSGPNSYENIRVAIHNYCDFMAECREQERTKKAIREVVKFAKKKERLKIWEGINGMIEDGDLGGNGCDMNAQRNGTALAANWVASLLQCI